MLKVPDAFQKLIDSVESTMRHAIVEEEHIPFDTVTNFDEVMNLLLKNKQRFPYSHVLRGSGSGLGEGCGRESLEK